MSSIIVSDNILITSEDANIQVSQLYIACFGRVPDSSGLAYWSNAILSGISINAVAESFTGTPEYNTIYPLSLSNDAFVSSIYQNVFNRQADASGLAFWSSSMTNGTNDRATLMTSMINAAMSQGVSNSDYQRINSQGDFGVWCANNGISVVDGNTQLHNVVNSASEATAKSALTTLATPIVNSTSGQIAYTLAMDNFSDAYLTSSAISTDFKNAIGDIAKYVNTLGTLDIAVHFENVASNVLAFFSGDGNNSFTRISSTLQSSFKGANYATEFQLEQKTGIDYNGSVADMNITINLGSDKYLSTSGVATVGKYDLTTILEHEIMHGLGITGFIGTLSSYNSKTEFDTYVNATIASAPYFSDGTTTIQLAPASAGSGSAYYHIVNQIDLMNSALSSGQIKHISTTDLTILTDLGYNVVNHVIA